MQPPAQPLDRGTPAGGPREDVDAEVHPSPQQHVVHDRGLPHGLARDPRHRPLDDERLVADVPVDQAQRQVPGEVADRGFGGQQGERPAFALLASPRPACRELGHRDRRAARRPEGDDRRAGAAYEDRAPATQHAAVSPIWLSSRGTSLAARCWCHRFAPRRHAAGPARSTLPPIAVRFMAAARGRPAPPARSGRGPRLAARRAGGRRRGPPPAAAARRGRGSPRGPRPVRRGPPPGACVR